MYGQLHRSEGEEQMVARGRAFLKRLARLVLMLFVVVYVLLCIVTAINFRAAGVDSLPGLGPQTTTTATPSQDQATMDKASSTAIGQQLKGQGYTARSVINNRDSTQWLNDQEKHDSINNPGPYVVFSKATHMAAAPGGDVQPDIVVDVTNGLQVALSQAYSDKRGAMCYNSTSDLRTLSAHWVDINVWLWHKSLDDPYEVKHDDLPQLPTSLGTVQCYTFTS